MWVKENLTNNPLGGNESAKHEATWSFLKGVKLKVKTWFILERLHKKIISCKIILNNLTLVDITLPKGTLSFIWGFGLKVKMRDVLHFYRLFISFIFMLRAAEDFQHWYRNSTKLSVQMNHNAGYEVCDNKTSWGTPKISCLIWVPRLVAVGKVSPHWN